MLVNKKYKVLHYPHSTLNKKTIDVIKGWAEDKEASSILSLFVTILAKEMLSSGGIGIAAPQVGFGLSIFVVSGEVFEGKCPVPYVTFINPRITTSGKENKEEEGCLSLPGVYISVKRPDNVVVEALDINETPFSLSLSGLPSRVVQHEYDHLEGKTMLYHCNNTEKMLALQKLKRWKRNKNE